MVDEPREPRERPDDVERSNIATLRRWVVGVFLALLIFVTVAKFVDDEFFGAHFVVDSSFYTLLGGMIAGLFSSEIVAALLSRRK
jgi:hypothetical protein